VSALINLVLEIKQFNPSSGCGRIAMQIFEAFGIIISRFAVGKILRKKNHRDPSANGPSWFTFIGHMKDSLWSVDIFSCESIGPASRTTEIQLGYGGEPNGKVVSIDHRRWIQHCNGLYKLPMAA
jgi:hypothetical protein